MLPDPLLFTYDTEAQSLARGAVSDRFYPQRKKRVAQTSSYNGQTAAGNPISVRTERSSYAEGYTEVQVFLFFSHPVDSADPFDKGKRLGNGISVSFVTNDFGYESTVDIPLLRAALDDLVDTVGVSRLLNGEI